MMKHGQIKWFSDSRSYGFVSEVGTDEEIFLHRNAAGLPVPDYNGTGMTLRAPIPTDYLQPRLPRTGDDVVYIEALNATSPHVHLWTYEPVFQEAVKEFESSEVRYRVVRQKKEADRSRLIESGTTCRRDLDSIVYDYLHLPQDPRNAHRPILVNLEIYGFHGGLMRWFTYRSIDSTSVQQRA